MSDISAFVGTVFVASMHVKRVRSPGNAASGVSESGSRVIYAIGVGLAQANELQRKHVIKYVDRPLSHPVLNLPICSATGFLDCRRTENPHGVLRSPEFGDLSDR
ncbi:hypothetical protein FJU30_24010 [Affinibrenneria salicis]|uniref:Uncharacterized protein n=1 Tax=Affinibrenneria salicis TaxID=2590031 RepID=A0A5J5FSB4_9GAMM|nr:hypothetical protein [Affinibrenneria salicis]KAA8995628.1 hypothetical protein FJU30_24010 [Affinibrenneria salicis]